MPVTLVPATLDHAVPIFECGGRAFRDDGMNKALFPIDPNDPDSLAEMADFRLKRIKKRLQVPGALSTIAIDPSVEDGKKVLGFALWFQGNTLEQSQNKQDPLKEGDSATPSSGFPRTMNLEAFSRIEKMLGEAKQELVGNYGDKLWCKYEFLCSLAICLVTFSVLTCPPDLASLAVDPDYGGKGIGSMLIKEGLGQIQKLACPVYVESTPAAVGVYKKLGFVLLRELVVIEDPEYRLTLMLKTPDSG
jgi:ribosomal protein S18 acetylase RimI-like enzyme